MQQQTSITQVVQILLELETRRFTGSLSLIVKQRPVWKFYLRLGRLVWQDGGAHSKQRWYRHLRQFCPQLTSSQLQAAKLDERNNAHEVLSHLLGQRLISQTQAVELAKTRVVEAVFDVQQYEWFLARKQRQPDSTALRPHVTPDDAPANLLVVLETSYVLQVAQQGWQQWAEVGLAQYSPNLFPAVRDLEILRAQRLTHQGAKALRSVSGTHSLRDLAFKAKCDVATVTRSLLPLV
ncbi:MAG: hypothetical protein AAGF24_09825, partial [Cyanobacteria bacterium P01_H01_bin.121]